MWHLFSCESKNKFAWVDKNPNRTWVNMATVVHFRISFDECACIFWSFSGAICFFIRSDNFRWYRLAEESRISHRKNQKDCSSRQTRRPPCQKPIIAFRANCSILQKLISYVLLTFRVEPVPKGVTFPGPRIAAYINNYTTGYLLYLNGRRG